MTTPPNLPPSGAQSTQTTPSTPPHGKASMSEALDPFMLLAGHALAAAIGFTMMAAISQIPIAVLAFLKHLGGESLDFWKEAETWLLRIDGCLSGFVALAGVALFVVEIYVETERGIIKAWKRRHQP